MSCTQENEFILYAGNAGNKAELNYSTLPELFMQNTMYGTLMF